MESYGFKIEKTYSAPAANLDGGDYLLPAVKSVDKEKISRPQSYLDRTVEDLTSTAAKLALGEDDKTSRSHDEVEKYSKMFIKAVPLFLGRRVGLASTVGVWGADEAKPQDSLGLQVQDFTLGAAKGAALKGTMHLMGSINSSPATKGMAMGITDRTSQTALTRENWLDGNGDASMTAGVNATLRTAFDPRAMAMDAALFGASEFTIGKLNYVTKGALYRHPALPMMATGGVFGLGSGASEELFRQRRDGEDFDMSKIMYRASMAASVNALAAGVGGLDRVARMRIDPEAQANALKIGAEKPSGPVPERVARFNELDARQLELKNSPLTIKEPLNEVAYRAEIVSNGQVKPVLFRLAETPEMKARFNNELFDYQLHRSLAPGTESRAVAPVEVVINGQKRQGYLQELSGRSFEEGLRAEANFAFGLSSDRAAARVLRNDPFLRSQYEKVWIERMLMAEWDNHSHNLLLGRGNRMSNIDFADALPSARYTSDYTPYWGKTASRVSLLNDRLISQFSGKPISAESHDMVKSFVRDFDTPAGRLALTGAGHSGSQIDGLLGRARWFSEKGAMPERDMPNVFVQASLRALYLLRKGQSLRFESGVNEKPAH